MFFNVKKDGLAALPLRMPLAVASALGLIALCGVYQPALAGPGHDHDDEQVPAVMPGVALPRFTAVSERFELVGVINGEHVTLYLDDADTNAPVVDAELTLAFGAEKIVAERHAAGEFEAQLSAAPAAGVVLVTASVTTAQESDVLTGELDIHEAEDEAAAQDAPAWRKFLPWGALGGIAFVGIGAGVARSRRDGPSSGDRRGNADDGGAA